MQTSPNNMPAWSLRARRTCWALCTSLLPALAPAAGPACDVASGERLTPVIELFTSEGCSSCPPADQWLSSLKGQPVVAQAFHVAYWDYIGWKDRFASPVFTVRQRELGTVNHLQGIYTPQVVRNGRDWRQWRQPGAAARTESVAGARIHVQRVPNADQFEAHVEPLQTTRPWTAYWTVTEHGHQSRVTAGENSGEVLKHDFVVRQYVPVGQYTGARMLKFHPLPASAGYPRQINLVVSDARSSQPLQAVSLACN